MKTLTKQHTGTFLTVALTIIFLLNLTPANSQSKRRNCGTMNGFAISNLLTGSGHGSVYSLSYSYTCSNNMVNLGAFYDNRSNTVNGGTVEYRRYFISPNRKLSGYFNATSLFRARASLTDNRNNLMHETEYVGEFETYTTIEQYVGFGLQRELFLGFNIDASVGVGGYYSQIDSGSDNRITMYRMYREDAFMAIQMKIALGYRF